jgi:hypothetical protein
LSVPAVERQEDRFKLVLEAKDWREVAAMFNEMGADIDRCVGQPSTWLTGMCGKNIDRVAGDIGIVDRCSSQPPPASSTAAALPLQLPVPQH